MSKKEETVYSAFVKKYPSMGLPASLAEFKKLFPSHRKFDRDAFLIDFAHTLAQDLGGRMDFLYYRTYPGDMAVFSMESNFLRATVGKESVFKLYMKSKVVQLGILNAIDTIKLGSDEKPLVDAMSAVVKFLREVMWKEFSGLLKIIQDGWKSRVEEKREVFQPSYIR